MCPLHKRASTRGTGGTTQPTRPSKYQRHLRSRWHCRSDTQLLQIPFSNSVVSIYITNYSIRGTEMSSEGLVELEQFWHTFLTERYVSLAAATLVLYEHAITLSAEIDFIWTRKSTGATLIFLILHWYGPCKLFLSQDTFSPCVALQGCDVLTMFSYIMELVLFAITAVFLALRAYAIGNYRLWPALAALVLALVPVATNGYAWSRTSYAYVEYVDDTPICTVNLSISSATNNKCDDQFFS
ncbi:hypothetical protein AcW1_008843 [Taiwanofungus camphoratus]|nr:hypothetical protein AcW1_008843 [Antrodia cinnamomea]